MMFRTRRVFATKNCDVRGSQAVVRCGISHSAVCRVVWIGALVTGFIASAEAATFGTIVPIRGHVSDIALDPGRGVLYAANFTANRIEVVSTANLSLQQPILVANQPSTLALSADGRFLVIGHYTNSVASATALTIIDLNANTTQTSTLDGSSVLSVAFGNSPQALVMTNNGVLLVDPVTAKSNVLQLNPFDS